MKARASRIKTTEQQARRILLAEAIDTTEVQGRKLVSAAERASVQAAARNSTLLTAHADESARVHAYLDHYASGIVDAASRHPDGRQLAAMQGATAWLAPAAIGLPLLALLLGVLCDQIANPHRVDLLSLPLLAVVAWNLALYLLLVLQLAMSSFRGQAARAPLAEWQRWAGDAEFKLQRKSALHTRVTAAFYTRWLAATAALSSQRIRCLLHVAAAAWALGLIISLLSRGLVVEYRAGWESTFLNAAQVHALLNALFLPVVALLPVEPFTLAEVAGLRFDAAAAGAGSGGRWAWLYVGLLGLVVVFPRLVLAAIAGWRVKALKQKVELDLGSAYFQELMAAIMQVRVQLGVLSHHEHDRQALLRVMTHGAPSPAFVTRSLITTADGDELLLCDLPLASPAPPGASAPVKGGGLPSLITKAATRLRAKTAQPDTMPGLPSPHPLQRAPDVVLHLVADPQDLVSSGTRLQELGQPVVHIVHAASAEKRKMLVNACRASKSPAGLATVISYPSLAGLEVGESALLAAIESLLPPAQKTGFARLRLAWQARDHNRFTSSMQALADHLLLAARQREEVPQPGLSIRSLKPGERQAQSALMAAARTRVAQTVDDSAARLHALLCQLHGLDADSSAGLRSRMDDSLALAPQQGPQRFVAGTTGAAAGAAAGATVGAHVDLFTLGATLGAGAALGALVGGGAALAAAVWSEPRSRSGAALIRFSDDMMQAMLESGLLHYLAAAHAGRAGSPPADEDLVRWRKQLAHEVRQVRPALMVCWQQARDDLPQDSPPLQSLTTLLEEVTGTTLKALTALHRNTDGVPASAAVQQERPQNAGPAAAPSGTSSALNGSTTALAALRRYFSTRKP